MNIFSTVVKVGNGAFGVKYDLFAIGLNSLMAVRAVRLCRRLSVSTLVSITSTSGMCSSRSLYSIYFRPTVRELDTLIIDAMGKDSRVIREAEDADADFIIEFLPIKKKGIEPRFFIIHDISDMATLFVRLGAYIPNEMYALADKHFGSETGFWFDRCYD